MLILGLDPSLSCTGWGIVRAEGSRLAHVANGQIATDAKALEGSLGEPESVKLGWKPNVSVEVGEGDAQTLFKLVDALEDDDDVQTVWGNYEVSDEVMEKIG